MARRHVAIGIGVYGLTFVGATALGVMLHGNLAATRRMAATIANDVLAGLFEGKIVVDDVARLDLGPRGHVHITHVVVTDPQGRMVIDAKGVDADIDLVRLLGSFVSGTPPKVLIGDARIDDAEVVIDEDPDGTIGIARAFHPRPKTNTAPEPSAPPKPPNAEDVILSIDRAYVRHAHARGNIAPPALDGDADEVHARLGIHENVFTLDIESAKTTLRSPKIPTQVETIAGDATGHLSLPLKTSELTVYGDLRGMLGAIPFTAHAGMTNDKVDASLDVPRAEPDAVTHVFPSVVLTEPVELHAKADGTLPVIAIHATARGGRTEAKIDGEIDMREGYAFKVDVDADHADAHLVRGPVSDVSFTLHGEGNFTVAPNATFRLASKEGTVADERVPAIAAEGRWDGTQLVSTFRATERGVDASGKITLDAPKRNVAFDVQARSNDLSKIARAPNVVRGSASARALGNLDLKTGALRGRVTADGDGVGAANGTVAASHTHVDAALGGTMSAPALDATASATDVKLTAPGKEPLVYSQADAHARVTFVSTPRLSDVTVEIDGGGARKAIALRAASIDFSPAGPRVRGATITGLGAPIEADIDIVGGPRWSMRVKATDLDVARVARVTHIPELRALPPKARASVDIDLVSDGAHTEGHADLEIQSEEGLAADVHLVFDRRHVSGHAKGSLAALGSLDVTEIELDLPGPLDARTARRATGFAEVRGDIDLAQVGLPFESIERISGHAFFEGRIERGDPNALPAIRTTVHTQALEVTRSDGEVLHGVDLVAHAAWDGRTNDTELAAIASDERGVIASVQAKTELDLVGLASLPALEAIREVATSPLDATVDMPPRAIANLPPMLVPVPLLGRVTAHGELEGSLAEPHLYVRGRVNGLTEKKQEARNRYEPIDGSFEAEWDGEHVVVSVGADERDAPEETRSGRPNARRKASARVRGIALGALSAREVVRALRMGTKPSWSGDAELDVEDLELSPIPIRSRMRGVLTGRASLRGLGQDPRFEASGHVDRFAISGARVDALDVHVGAHDGSLFASAQTFDAGKTVLDVRIASRALVWKKLAPGWNAQELTRVDYVANGVRLALLRTFARRSIADLDGRIDGNGSAMFDANSQTFEGGLSLSSGQVYVKALGQDVTNVNATAKFEKNGVFRIENATAKVDQGELRASATGRMKGLTFVGANANIVIPSKNGIPLSSEGVVFADATGEVDLTAKMSDDRKTLLVGLDIPRATIELPRRETPNLQPLADDEHIETGIRGRTGQLVFIPIERRRSRMTAAEEEQEAEAVTTRFDINLGRDVILEGNGLRVQLRGKTIVTLAKELAVDGRIDLAGGTMEAHGRNFTIDHGSVTFDENGDPANPTVVAAAYWDAPDKTRIWVEFSGPLKTGSLTLRSEPAFSKNEILSILLFGRPDPNMATAGQRPDDASKGVAVASGFVATDVNQALAKLDENLQIETDTLSGNRTRTKLGYRVARTVRVLVGVAPGKSYREPDTTYLFLDWQFMPQWSLVATGGDKGTSILDVIFQHRY